MDITRSNENKMMFGCNPNRLGGGVHLIQTFKQWLKWKQMQHNEQRKAAPRL